MKKYMECELFALLMQSSNIVEDEKLQAAYEEFVKIVSEDTLKDMPGVMYGRLSYSRSEIESLIVKNEMKKKCI